MLATENQAIDVAVDVVLRVGLLLLAGPIGWTSVQRVRWRDDRVVGGSATSFREVFDLPG